MVGHDLTILVVDDNDGCRDLYALWLEGRHEVWTAADGDEAIDRVSDDVDLVLLDRDMPGPSGTAVAEHIEANHDCYVVMVSSRPVDFDVVELPIDDYVEKPVDRDEIRGIVVRYISQQSYQQALDEFFALTAKLASLESRKSRAELEASETYARLKWLVEEKRAQVDHALDQEETDWSVVFETCTSGVSPSA
ncbi:response regulator [Halobacteriales archaeon Cl-PHB]